MSTTSKIEWTDRTWNPVRGCSEVSEGCRNCYAMRQAHRFNQPGGAYEGLTRMADRGPIWTGNIRLDESALEAPLRWKKPSRVFVNSMSDLFHESVPDDFLDRVFAVMALTPRHTYQILTKRPGRMCDYLSDLNYRKEQVGVEAELMSGFDRSATDSPANVTWPLANVWLGVSVENQATADERIPLLLRTPAAVRFLSVEPLLGPVNLEWEWRARTTHHDEAIIDWVIVGGESGPGARPCHLDWLRSVARQCQAAGVGLFVKQWGAVPVMGEAEWRDLSPTRLLSASKRDRFPSSVTLKLRDSKGGDPAEWPEDLRVREYPRCHKTDTNAKGGAGSCRLSA